MTSTWTPNRVRERPIIMTGESVRAILDGTKTQTRRVITQRVRESGQTLTTTPGWYGDGRSYSADDVLEYFGPCPYGQPGDRLWVRETWKWPHDGIVYRADLPWGESSYEKGWRSPIHMSRCMSRLTLELTEVRVQRVQEISEGDAKAEGAGRRFEVDAATFLRNSQWDPETASTHRLGFKHLWNEINARRGHGWDANPWVWALTFRRLP